MKKALFLLQLLFSSLYSFEIEPWFPYPLELHFRPSYFISYYPSINGLVSPSSYHSLNQAASVNFGFTTLSQFDMQIEAEFILKTKMLNPTLMSTGIQGRYLFLDDVQGDPLSVALGVNMRYVPDHVRRDPFCPYHSLVNFEMNAGLGKEFDHLEFWVYRIYAVPAIGIANQGAMWVKALASFELSSRDNKHDGALTLDSYFGFGNKHFINLDQFSGYYNIWHQNIDLSAMYRYHFDIWGAISVSLGYRPYALDYPAHQTYLLFKYDLPLSLF
jgi:hypothetical protein